MVIRVDIRPEMIRWARERAGRSVESLRGRFPRIEQWETGDISPTLKQLEAFARALWVPIGFLFGERPPEEDVPIPDFRSGRRRGTRPSPHLLDTVYLCQMRQAWYADHARVSGEPPRPFVGSLTTGVQVEAAAATMRDDLGFDLVERGQCRTWEEALALFVQQAEAIGVLVMRSGIYLNNTHRKLDPEEFRGFAIADPLAPLVFINAADTKAAQGFTLAHELAHVWLGSSALSDAEPSRTVDGEVETWCNRVAAELLVPMVALRDELHQDVPVATEIARLARRFKVSTLVILRRMLDAGALTWQRFHLEYEAELARILDRTRGGGGDFYLTQPARASRRFAEALVASTLEGHTLYTDALRMLGIRKVETFHELGRNLHVIV